MFKLLKAGRRSRIPQSVSSLPRFPPETGFFSGIKFLIKKNYILVSFFLFQNLTLFGSAVRLPVEKLRNPAGELFSLQRIPIFSENPGFEFEVVTFERTACVGVGPWTLEASWYPGYLWKACVCPKCRYDLQQDHPR